MYVAGNVVEGFAPQSLDNVKGVRFKKGDAKTVLVDKPFDVVPVKRDSAEDAFNKVLAQSGAIRPKRDAVDERILRDVRERTGSVINSPADVGGWPELKSAEAPADVDHDGMPDEWERKHGLDPQDPKDGPVAKESGGYTNLEVYLNELASQ
jgi:hypothetical protein